MVGAMVAALLGATLGASVLVSPFLPVVLVGLAVCVGAASLLPVRPIHFLYLLIVAIPFSAALPRGALVPLLVPSEALLLVALALAALYAVLARRDQRIPGYLLAAAAVFVAGTALVPLASYLYRGIPLDAAELLNLVAPAQYVALFWMCALVPRSGAERRGAVQLMILAGTAVASIGLLQAAGVGPVVSWLQAWYPSPQTDVSLEIGRVTSVFGAWNALGLFLVTTLLLVASTYPGETRPLYRLNMRVATVACLVCLLATNLWSGAIGVVAGFAFIKWLDPRGLRAVVPVGIVALVGAALLLPDIVQRFEYQGRVDSWVPETLQFRWAVWRDVFVPRIAESPIWGVRPSYTGLSWPHPESQYVAYLYQGGLVALVAHLLWLALTARWLYLRARDVGIDALARTLSLTALSLLLVLTVVGAINPVFTYAGTVDYLWIMLALIVSGGRIEDHGTT